MKLYLLGAFPLLFIPFSILLMLSIWWAHKYK